MNNNNLLKLIIALVIVFCILPYFVFILFNMDSWFGFIPNIFDFNFLGLGSFVGVVVRLVFIAVCIFAVYVIIKMINSNKSEEHTESYTEKITLKKRFSLDIEMQVGYIKIEPCENFGKTLYIDVSKSDEDNIKLSYENGCVKVLQTKKKGVVNSFINEGGSKSQYPNVTIKLPRDLACEFIATKNNIGNTIIENCGFAKSKITSDIGKISLKDCTLENCEMKSNVGAISIEKTKITDGKIKTDIGKIDFVGTLCGDNNFTSQVGKIDVTLTDGIGNYEVVAKSDIGSVNVDRSKGAPESGKGFAKLTVNSQIGAVNVK